MCAKIHHTAYLFRKKHGMGSTLLSETPVIKLCIIQKIDYGQFTECFILLFLDIFTFHIVLHIICKYIQNLLVCCPCMTNELVLLYNTFAYLIPVTTSNCNLLGCDTVSACR